MKIACGFVGDPAVSRDGPGKSSHNCLMGGFLVVIGLALVAALGVIVLANAAGDGGGDLRTFWADLRSGLRRRRDADERVLDEAEPEPVDVAFEELFAAASQPDDGYLQLDELAEMLERTGERAARLREHLPHAVAPAAGHRPVRRSGHVPLGRVVPSRPASTPSGVPAPARTGTSTATTPPPSVPPQQRGAA